MTATASSVNVPYNLNAPSQAIDGIYDQSSFWHSTGATNEWLQLTLSFSVEIVKYAITARSQSCCVGDTPSSWTFQGSSDGSSWTNLDAVVNQAAWAPGETRWFICNKLGLFRYYRLFVTDCLGRPSGLKVIVVAEITFQCRGFSLEKLGPVFCRRRYS